MSKTIDMTGQMTPHARNVFDQVAGPATALCQKACAAGASTSTHYVFACETAPGTVDLLVLEFANVERDFAGDGWDKICRDTVLAHKPIDGFMRVLVTLQDGCVFGGGLPVVRQQVTLSKGGQA